MSDQPIPMTGSSPEVHVVVPRRYQPVATLVILALTGVTFLLMTLAGGSTSLDVLLDFGAAYAPYFRRGEYWRLVMPMFLHIGVWHLLVNGYALFVLGRLLERVYGYGRFALLYVGCGVGSAFLSMERSTNVSAGASGAIFGIAGAMLVTGYLHRDAVPPRWGRAFGGGILPFIVLNLALGYYIPHIDNWGHLGGLASGLLLALVVRPPRYEPFTFPPEEPSQAVVILPLAVVLVAMGATVDSYRMSRAVARMIEEGRRLRAAQQLDRALARFEDAAHRAPNDERPHEELGSLYLAQGRIAAAIREYNEALRLSPVSPRAQLGLALAYRQKGDLAKARQLIEAALGKNPDTADGHQALADLCAEQKLYPEAIQHYEAALRLEPNLASAHNNLAWLYATSDDPKHRDPSAALKHAQRAVELSDGKEAAFLDTLAEALYANRRFDEAVKVQTRALKLEPDNSELREHMARYRKTAGV